MHRHSSHCYVFISIFIQTFVLFVPRACMCERVCVKFVSKTFFPSSFPSVVCCALYMCQFDHCYRLCLYVCYFYFWIDWMKNCFLSILTIGIIVWWVCVCVRAQWHFQCRYKSVGLQRIALAMIITEYVPCASLSLSLLSACVCSCVYH